MIINNHVKLQFPNCMKMKLLILRKLQLSQIINAKIHQKIKNPQNIKILATHFETRGLREFDM